MPRPKLTPEEKAARNAARQTAWRARAQERGLTRITVAIDQNAELALEHLAQVWDATQGEAISALLVTGLNRVWSGLTEAEKAEFLSGTLHKPLAVTLDNQQAETSEAQEPLAVTLDNQQAETSEAHKPLAVTPDNQQAGTSEAQLSIELPLPVVSASKGKSTSTSYTPSEQAQIVRIYDREKAKGATDKAISALVKAEIGKAPDKSNLGRHVREWRKHPEVLAERAKLDQ